MSVFVAVLLSLSFFYHLLFVCPDVGTSSQVRMKRATQAESYVKTSPSCYIASTAHVYLDFWILARRSQSHELPTH